MTRIVGNDGAAALTGHLAVFDNWAATIATVLGDVTGFGDGWKRVRGGKKSGTFSAGGHSDGLAAQAPLSTAIVPEGAAVALTLTTGCTLTGTGVVGNVAFNSDVQGDQTIAFDGEFTGPILETWDETSGP